jgi:hypothetical protein
MLDHVESRLWAEHGHQFSDQVARAFSKGWIAFQRLNAIQFDAPWQRETRKGGRPGHA